VKYKYEIYQQKKGINMEKDNNELNQIIKNRENKETLEISSTGYGLESVSNELNEKNHVGYNPSSCGGL
jgi:activator of 2-hydroxyglutaryl-CoA dehydratase